MKSVDDLAGEEYPVKNSGKCAAETFVYPGAENERLPLTRGDVISLAGVDRSSLQANFALVGGAQDCVADFRSLLVALGLNKELLVGEAILGRHEVVVPADVDIYHGKRFSFTEGMQVHVQRVKGRAAWVTFPERQGSVLVHVLDMARALGASPEVVYVSPMGGDVTSFYHEADLICRDVENEAYAAMSPYYREIWAR